MVDLWKEAVRTLSSVFEIAIVSLLELYALYVEETDYFKD